VFWFLHAPTSSDDRNSLAAKSKIESSTIDSARGEGAKAVQKRRLQIWITRGPKFEEHRAEVCLFCGKSLVLELKLTRFRLSPVLLPKLKEKLLRSRYFFCSALSMK
jgi:hypothetical protein